MKSITTLSYLFVSTFTLEIISPPTSTLADINKKTDGNTSVISQDAETPYLYDTVSETPVGDQQTYCISDAQCFASLEKRGVNVRQILGKKVISAGLQW